MPGRRREEERTGFQEGGAFGGAYDLQTDFVMAYGTGETMPERIRQWKEAGYVVHLMTGVSWGNYGDYLDGRFDGRSHWDEAQTYKDGERIIHGTSAHIPYMIPTLSYADFLAERIRPAVDAGVDAIHLEEPEIWVEDGYSAAFKREWRMYYGEDWQPPHASEDAQYRASKLKSFLYARCLDRVCSALKDYSLVRYGRPLRFYVPTHSLINYTQWRIVSPESRLLELPSIDGYIAQVWTGTSRTANVYEGRRAERTFETAFLEYGIMQELVRGTGKRMWFLHDPIEDDPKRTWSDYRTNYIKTLIASLLHPDVARYEVAPWPRRIFAGRYAGDDGVKTGIPGDYATLLLTLMQTLRNMDQPLTDGGFDDGSGVGDGSRSGDGSGVDDGSRSGDSNGAGDDCGVGDDSRSGDGSEVGVGSSSGGKGGIRLSVGGRARAGVLLADSAMFQRMRIGKETAGFLLKYDGTNEVEISDEDALELLDFSDFYGLTLPLLKHGLPVRPVQLDNARRFPGYLDDYRLLVLSYEFMKPEHPDLHVTLAQWVREGGLLLYVGDDRDPYHRVREWWNAGRRKYSNPREHLFECLGLLGEASAGLTRVGDGAVLFLHESPRRLAASREGADRLRRSAAELLELKGDGEAGSGWEPSNAFRLRRGPYVIVSVMEDSVHDQPMRLQGLYVNLLDPALPIVRELEVRPGEQALLYDLEAADAGGGEVVASSSRIERFELSDRAVRFTAKGPLGLDVVARIRCPFRPATAVASAEDGAGGPIPFDWDGETGTLLLRYEHRPGGVRILVSANG